MTTRSSIRNFFILLLPFFGTGCAVTKYLEEEQTVLYEQEIKGANKVDESELTDFYRQEPNVRVPLTSFAPYVWIYQLGYRNYDKEEIRQEKQATTQKLDQKIATAQEKGKEGKVVRLEKKKDRKVSKLEQELEEGNLFMRWGEPLTVYDTSLANTTRTQMENYLHTKGYFNGTVEHSVDVENRKVTSIYTVQENTPYIVDTVVYQSEDSSILRLIYNNLKSREIKQGEVYDQDKLGGERERIENILKNRGYYDFSRQYIDFKVDSTVGDHQVKIYTQIKEPAKRGYHKQFAIDSIIFTTDADAQGVSGERQTSSFNNITYRYYDYQYYKKILDRRVFIRPDSLYSRDETLQTQRQLSNLDVFKFVNINYDTSGGKFIANIYASPLKKYETSSEAGFNLSQGYPGPFGSTTLRIRNVFGGLEILDINARAGIEGVPAVTEIGGSYRSVEAGGNLALTFPQFIFPLPNDWKSSLARLNPKTRLQTGVNYTNRPEYVRTTFQATTIYNWQKEQKILYNFTPIDINYIDSRIQQQEFDSILDNSVEDYGFSLRRSFLPSVVTSMSFSTVFNFNNYGSSDLISGADQGNPAYLRLFAEAGGTIFNFFGTDLLKEAGLEYFKFLKFNADFRQYLTIAPEKTLAYRINVGIAKPYGGEDDGGGALPYEKYFFAGGPNSVRAWAPRRLGPGSIPPDSIRDGEFYYQIEQPGEIILETSVEYRQKLFGFVHGALFVDAGNVWRLQDLPAVSADGEPRRGSAKFNFSTFPEQIAIGAGPGLRFDFSFLIVRFDWGVKIYDPARSPGERWIGQKFTIGQEFLQGVPNIGIGYPF